MPAKFQKSYKYIAPDGQQFDTLVEEQKHEIENLFMDILREESVPKDFAAKVVMGMVDHRAELVAILSQRERKHASPATPKARKPRKAKTEPTPVVKNS